MKSNLPASNHPQQQSNVRNLLTPEMRRQILKLKHELNKQQLRLSGRLENLSNIRDALEIARYSASCLLANDPFKAWEQVAKRREDEWDLVFEEQDRKKTVKKLITRQQQIVEAKKRLENYANCLDGFFDDVTKLASLDTAMQLAEDLQCDEPLETAAAWKRRKKAEAAAAAAAAEDLDLPFQAEEKH